MISSVHKVFIESTTERGRNVEELFSKDKTQKFVLGLSYRNRSVQGPL